MTWDVNKMSDNNLHWMSHYLALTSHFLNAIFLSPTRLWQSTLSPTKCLHLHYFYAKHYSYTSCAHTNLLHICDAWSTVKLSRVVKRVNCHIHLATTILVIPSRYITVMFPTNPNYRRIFSNTVWRQTNVILTLRYLVTPSSHYY